MTHAERAAAVLTATAKAHCLREWDSVNDPPCHPLDLDWNGCHLCVNPQGAAAAIRAAVDQVLPVSTSQMGGVEELCRDGYRAQFLAIADALAAPQPAKG